ncbi:hypothetical protein HY251_00590 [bacterium]|nr:hypothetical protein [bacterium]
MVACISSAPRGSYLNGSRGVACTRSNMDQDDLLMSALEPGERIVWSDRPHGFFWPVRAAYRGVSPIVAVYATIVYAIAFLGPLVIALAALSGFWVEFLYGSRPGSATEFGVAAFLACLVGGPAAVVVVAEVRDFLEAQTTRYAVTDRGRAFVSRRDGVVSFVLPAPERVKTSARDGDEQGALDFGPVPVRRHDATPRTLTRPIVFHDVSAPRLALEAVRTAAAAGEARAPAARGEA